MKYGEDRARPLTAKSRLTRFASEGEGCRAGAPLRPRFFSGFALPFELRAAGAHLSCAVVVDARRAREISQLRGSVCVCVEEIWHFGLR